MPLLRRYAASLTNSAYVFDLTRTLDTVFDPSGAYPDENLFDDVGVKPDVQYSQTLATFARATWIM